VNGGNVPKVQKSWATNVSCAFAHPRIVVGIVPPVDGQGRRVDIDARQARPLIALHVFNIPLVCW
jgi:hypothetical protein